MDLFAKAVKKGVAKGYAIGQQQLQQHLAKQREPGAEPYHGNANGFSAQHDIGGNTLYSSYPQQQQQPQQYPTYNGPPPPLPPRQYQSPQPQSNYTTHPSSQNSPISYGIPAPVSYDPAASQTENSYSSIMPPPPPSYIPPPASTQPIQRQDTVNPPPVDSQRQDMTTSNAYDWRQDERLKPFLQPLRDVTAGFRDVTAPPTTDVTHVQPQPQPQQTEARQDTQGYLVRTSDGGFQLVQPNQQPSESPSYAASLMTTNHEAQTQQPPYTRPDYTTTIEPRIIEPRETQEIRAESKEQRVPDVSTSVEQQLSNLSLGGAPSVSETAPKSHQKAKKPINLPLIVEDGPGQEVVRSCPKDRLVDYPLYWYFLPDLPDAPICTRCHADYIQSSPLADNFTRKLAEADTVSSCHFRYPRVQNILWPAALRSRSLDDLAAFLSARLLIPNCKGRTATAAADGVKYYGMKDNDIDGFIACEACVQDHVAGTAFEPRLVPYPRVQGPDDRWICDASVRYVPRALAHYAPRADWQGFVDGAARRFKLTACDGQEKARGDSGNWFATRRAIDNVQVCEPCFMDRLALGPFADEFAQMPGPVDFDEYIVFLRQRWTCSLPDGAALPMASALAAAEEAGDFTGFARAAAAIAQLVPCTKHGILRGNWWTVAGDGGAGSDAFDLCEACYEGVMKPRGLDAFLQKKAAPAPEDTVFCNLCPSTPRHDEYARKLAEALDRGVFGGFAEHVRTFAAVRHCPRRDSLANARWWGYGGEAFACEECWLLFVRHTAVAARLPVQGTRDERAQICSLYSPRMRGRWRALCEAESGEEADAAVAGFREFATRRLQVWLATVPRMQLMREMKQMKMMQAMQQGQLSLMYQGMNSMAVLSGTDDGSWHGNSSIGWYETENGATGAQMFDNMQAGMADASRGDEWMQIFQLELQWQEVE